MSKSGRKKYAVVAMTLLLCFVLIFAFAACKDTGGGEEKQGEEGGSTEVTHNETVRPYFSEISEALSKSLSADLANGFYIGFNGAVKVGADEYAFDLDANVLPKDQTVGEVTTAANKDFRMEIKKGENLLFGLYNDESDLYLSAGVNKYHFTNASVMKALRSFITLNIPAYNELTNLESIAINADYDLKGFIAELLPVGFALLAADPNEADKEANLKVSKTGDTYKLTLYLANLNGLLEGVDLSAVADLAIDLNVTVANGFVKSIGLAVNRGGAAYAASLQSKVDGGLFGAVKADLDAAVPADLVATAASSVLQTNMTGQINIKNTLDDGTTAVLKTVDWKLVSKIDLFTLVDNNFKFSALPADNFFHFQLSHKCNDTCSAYCSANLVSAFNTGASNPLGERYKHTNLVDIAWDPDSLGTPNLFVDVSLWDLLTVNGLQSLLKGALNANLDTSMLKMAAKAVSSQLTFNIDLDAVVLKDNTVPRVTAEGGGNTGGVSTPALSLDFGKILSSINGLIALDKNAGTGATESVTLSVASLKNLLAAIAGDGAIIGSMSAAGLVDSLTDAENGVSAYSFTCIQNHFGHNADVTNYDTYNAAVKMNVNGNEKLASAPYNSKGVNPYGSYTVLFGSKSTTGSPALYTESVETSTNGTETCLNLYSLVGKEYVLISDVNNALTNYDLEVLYGGGIKNLYFKYTYVDFNKERKTAYGSVFGFQGLNLKKNGYQEVKLLASLMTAESFNTSLQKNLKSYVGGAIEGGLPNLEKILPVAADAFDGFKIHFNSALEPKNVKLIKESTEYKVVYNINDEIPSAASFEFRLGTKNNGKTYNYPVKVDDDVVCDGFEMMVPGTYSITYTIDEKYGALFPNGTNTMTEYITVKGYDSVKLTPNADFGVVTGENTDMNSKIFATVTYTFADGTEIVKDLKFLDFYNEFLIDDAANLEAKYNKIIVSTAGTYKIGIRLNDFAILYFDLTVTDPVETPPVTEPTA